ncbi:taste receptor type 2 member 39 [Anguilla rostrata]|uniref:taste receptor type 2 member 39 n=1 Tax=Anguilla anguilla TaxID=7936 RepID=UPI0015AA71B5|nr:taste receptor type 2 member 39 [Anguilla anguilla]
MLLSGDRTVIWVLIGVVAVFTIFFNVYIVLVSLRHYRENGHWLPCETIITAFALGSTTHQVVSYFFISLDKMDTYCILEDHVLSTLLVIIYSLKFCIVWLTAFLAFYYSTKLVVEPIHCYTKIQEAILKHVTTVVVVIYLCGFGSCMPMMAAFDHLHSNVDTYDCGILRPKGSQGVAYMAYYLLMSDIIPGLIMVKSSISISVHLAIHLRHMKASTNGFHTPKLGAEMRVIRMSLGLIAIFICFLVVDLYVHYVNTVQNQNVLPLTVLFSSIYTAMSSLVLIYGKKTLWKELLHMFNLFLDEYPCLSCLKVPEKKPDTNATPGH